MDLNQRELNTIRHIAATVNYCFTNNDSYYNYGNVIVCEHLEQTGLVERIKHDDDMLHNKLCNNGRRMYYHATLTEKGKAEALRNGFELGMKFSYRILNIYDVHSIKLISVSAQHDYIVVPFDYWSIYFTMSGILSEIMYDRRSMKFLKYDIINTGSAAGIPKFTVVTSNSDRCCYNRISINDAESVMTAYDLAVAEHNHIINEIRNKYRV